MRAGCITANEITCLRPLVTTKVPCGQRGVLPGYLCTAGQRAISDKTSEAAITKINNVQFPLLSPHPK